MGDTADECGGVPKAVQNGQNREFGRQILRLTIKFCGRTNSIFRFGIIKYVLQYTRSQCGGLAWPGEKAGAF